MDTIIPESTEQEVSVEQENATFFILGDAAYTSEIIEEYNRNAENKTNEFNSNSDAKVKEYNTNATNKTTAFDNNYDTKVAAFNKNAETQTETFNSNATTQVNNFNANATTSIQNYNANAEQKLYEFNANALSYEEGITDNSNRIKRLETDIFDSGTASGSLINIQDSTLAEFQELTIDGVSEQNVTQGYNLANVTNIPNNDILTVNADQSLTLANNPQSSGYTETQITLRTLAPDLVVGDTMYLHLETTFTSQASIYINGGTRLYESSSVTVTEDMLNNKVIIYGGATKVDTIRLQFTKGEPKTVWEPYTGGQPSPSPDYPQTIDVIDERFEFGSCGKNLYNYKDTVKVTTGITVDDNGWITMNYDNTEGTEIKYLDYWTNNLNLKTSTKYSLIAEIKNLSGDLRTEFASTTITSQNITGTYTLSSKLNLGFHKFLITTRDNFETAIYGLRTTVGFATGANSSITFRLSVLEDTSITADNFEYEPYQETLSTITLPDGEFAADGDLFRIVFNDEDGKYHLWLDKNIGKVVLDENITNVAFTASQNSDTHNTSYISVYKEDVLPNGRVISDYFRYANLWNTDVEGCWIGNSRHIALRIAKEKVSTTENFKTWCAENTPIFCYQLAEPYSLDLGSIDMPLTYYPVTNVFTTHDLQPIINVVYYRDIKNTITTMQTDIETLKEAVATLTANQTNLASEVDLLQEQTETESEVIE